MTRLGKQGIHIFIPHFFRKGNIYEMVIVNVTETLLQATEAVQRRGLTVP